MAIRDTYKKYLFKVGNKIIERQGRSSRFLRLPVPTWGKPCRFALRHERWAVLIAEKSGLLNQRLNARLENAVHLLVRGRLLRTAASHTIHYDNPDALPAMTSAIPDGVHS